jgi:hypothetical protein
MCLRVFVRIPKCNRLISEPNRKCKYLAVAQFDALICERAALAKLYEALAEAFLAEGVDTQFVLMGDGNGKGRGTIRPHPMR